MCYKTYIDKCGASIRIHLNRRNITVLKEACNESEKLILQQESRVTFHSPRFGCRKARKFRSYQKSDFCLYNVSIPSCESSGRLVLESGDRNAQENFIQNRKSDSECSDYLQFFYHNSSSVRYCGRELSERQIQIPATQFMAVFWTDAAINKPGFTLTARCLPYEGFS